ncbi:hydrolase [Alicyclobacillus pomorum]|uniref:hydrolase n=1 Tax=Alicyclobacillus pomorum TaxID=204470 RepID=UPI0004150211|nr:hydrolase [Alicyclobacillus pomorum]
MAQTLQLDPKTTALVVIDMQKGIVQLPCQPHSTEQVLQQTVKLADAFRAAGAFVVLVNVGSRDGKDMLHPITDAPPVVSGERPKDYAQIVPALGPKETDHLVTKHQWGAFYGTDLDLQLRRRGIQTIVLCGIATNIGVETTAREAFQHNYQQVFAEDAMTALSAVEHEHTVKYIFPRMGRVRRTDEIIAALK